MRYFLLLYDSYIGDWFLHGQWTGEEGKKKAEEIGRRSEGYMLIEGTMICKELYDDEY